MTQAYTRHGPRLAQGTVGTVQGTKLGAAQGTQGTAQGTAQGTVGILQGIFRLFRPEACQTLEDQYKARKARHKACHKARSAFYKAWNKAWRKAARHGARRGGALTPITGYCRWHVVGTVM